MTDDKTVNSGDLKKEVHRDFLACLKRENGLASEELSLFNWYFKESETIFKQLSASQEMNLHNQQANCVEDIDDSGSIPIQYFIKRSRYSHIIYLCSIGEKFLSDACRRLSIALANNIPFSLEQLSGDKWEKKRLFLERYGYGRIPIPDEIWIPFRQIYTIRNDLVHENGSIAGKEFNKKTTAYKNIDGISIIDNEIVIAEDFINNSAIALTSFVDYVNGRINLAIDPAINLKSAT
ncbi:MAG: hypothetical protein Q7T62_09495 [Undibacterium sp.]|nr:hypothetical protein [Undibacterium sp.]